MRPLLPLASCSLALVGCGAPPRPNAAPPPPASSAPIPAPPADPRADPPGAAPGLSALRPFKKVDAKRPWSTDGDLVPTQKGAVAVFHLRGSDRRCAVKNGGDCVFARFAPYKDPGRAKAEVIEPSVDQRELGPFGEPLRWPLGDGALGLFGTREGVIAVSPRRDVLLLTLVDETGKAREVASEPVPGLIRTTLVETAGGLAGIGAVPADHGPPEYVSFTLERQGDRLKLGKLHRLDAVLAGGAERPKGKRWVAEGDRGQIFTLAPVVDKKNHLTRDWAAAWMEVVPADPKAKSPARTHLLHVTVFGPDGAARSDRSRAPTEEMGWPERLTAGPSGFVVNALELDRSLRHAHQAAPFMPTVKWTPDLEGRADQRVVAVGWDAKEGEGLVVFEDGVRQSGQRFSWSGDAIEGPFELPKQLAAEAVAPAQPTAHLARVGAAWVGFDKHGVQSITGARAGRSIAWNDGEWPLLVTRTWMIPAGDGKVDVYRRGFAPSKHAATVGGGDVALVVARVDLEAGNTTPFELVPGWAAGGATKLRVVREVVPSHEGGVLVLGETEKGEVTVLHRKADGTWGAERKLGGEVRGSYAGLSRVDGDDVVSVVVGAGTKLHWLRGGGTADGPLFTGSSLGPLLFGTEHAAPREPGPPQKLAGEVRRAFEMCPTAFATGPRRAVLVCAETDDERVPGRAVGTRVVRW